MSNSNYRLRALELNTENIVSYSGNNPIFNAGMIEDIPLVRNLSVGATTGSVLTYNGSTFQLSSGFTGAANSIRVQAQTTGPFYMVTSTGASNTGALYANTGIYTSGSTIVTGQMIAGTTGTTNYPVRSYTSDATTALGIVYEAVNSNLSVGSANIGFNVADAATEVSQHRQSFGVVRTGTYGV